MDDSLKGHMNEVGDEGEIADIDTAVALGGGPDGGRGRGMLVTTAAVRVGAAALGVANGTARKTASSTEVGVKVASL